MDASARDMWRSRPRYGERVLQGLFFLSAALSIFVTFGIAWIMLSESVAFFRRPEVSLLDFFTDTQWTPLFAEKHFGIMVLASATLLITMIALAVALPTGLLTAIFLSEYASERVRRVVKPFLEILAGVPTVVYGYFALTFVTPFLKKFIPVIATFNSLSAGLVMGIMLIPMVASLSEDAIYAVPQSLREAAYALGVTKREVVTGVVIPAALSGIVASFILAMSRAIGETMIVTIAAGQNPRLTLNPFVPVETMTAYIVQVSLGDTPHGSLEYQTLFAVGATLFIFTFALNLFSHWFVRRYRERYE